MSSDAPPKPRRWLRFSLRALLLITAVAAVSLAVQVNKAQKRRAAFAAIEAAGGSIAFDSPSNDGYRVGWFDALGDEYRQQPLSVYLSADVIDAAMLKHLNNLPPDSTLYLDGADPKEFAELLPTLTVTHR